MYVSCASSYFSREIMPRLYCSSETAKVFCACVRSPCAAVMAVIFSCMVLYSLRNELFTLSSVASR